MYVDVTPQNKVDGRAADAAADGSLFGLLVNSFGCWNLLEFVQLKILLIT